MKKINIYKQVLLIVVSFCISNISFSQDLNKVEEVDSVFANYLLVNSANPQKIIELKDNGPYNLAYIQKLTDSTRTENIFLLSGNIRYLNDNDLDFDIRNEAIEQNFKDGSIISTQNDYSSFYYSKNQVPRKINLGDIKYVNYSSPTRTLFHSIGISTMFASAATTLVLAPLLNMNFKTGDFNGNGYVSLATVGLAGFAVSVPITLLTKIKRYNIADKQKQDEEFWYFEKIENITNE